MTGRSVPLFVVLSLGVLHAQDTQEPAVRDPLLPSQTPADRNWVRDFSKDQGAIWSSPLHLKQKDLRWMLPFAAGTAALIAADTSIADAMPNTQAQIRAGERLSKLGAPYALGGVAAGTYILGRMTHNDRARETGRIGMEALVHTYLVTHALKFASGRERPEDADGRGTFFQNRRSFPSGHSMMTWSLAAVIAHEYPNRKAVRYGAYAFALAVNAGRMTAQKHYAADSLVGGVFGYLIGSYLYEKHHNRKLDGPYARQRTSKIPDILPHFDRVSRNYGVSLAWQW